MFYFPHWSNETKRIVSLFPERGVFLTGIEGSDPHIDGVRRNQLREAHDFYVHYETRLRTIRDLGITWLRFGAPYSQVHIAPQVYDFAFVDKVVATCDALGIEIMADLLHFGLPDWMHEDTSDTPFFQNPRFPEYFAQYAAAFAARYPHIRCYTLVNEPFLTAFFSAKLGLWNEQQYGTNWQDDRAFVRAAANISKAAVLGRKAIERVWQEEQRATELVFIQNESFEKAIATPESGRESEAAQFNMRRFLCLDLIFGTIPQDMRNYLMSQGLTTDEIDWFAEHGASTKTVLGIDHYPTCIHTYERDRTVDHTPTMPYQLAALTREYWERYPLPLLHTEVNGWPEHAESICQQTYDAMVELRQAGYPVLGMGWYGDELQVGWHVAMRGPESMVENPVGLSYKGQVQPVGVLFSALCRRGFCQVTEVLPEVVQASHSA